MRLAFADPANIHQKALKEPVLALHLCRDLATGLRERRTVIGRVVDQPLFAQFLEHLGDARVPYAETRRQLSCGSDLRLPFLPRVYCFKILLF